METITMQSGFNGTLIRILRFRNRGLLILAVVIGCTSTSRNLASSAVPEQASTGAPKVLWTYEGKDGPKHWGALSKDFEECSLGHDQSPVDITRPVAKAKEVAGIVFDYRAAKVSVENNGHTIQVNYEPGNSIQVNGATYELVQFHFHAPSEHTIDGKHADAEVHLVHRNAAGQLAVVGVLIKKGLENRASKSLWDNLPTHAGPARPLSEPVNPDGLLPVRRTSYRYEGSLTTPPCAEGVTWMVMTEPIQLSAMQLKLFEKLIKRNNRPVQPLNRRTVIEDTTQ